VVRAFVLVLLWLAPAASVQAQSLLGGVVRDPTGQIATDVDIVVENELTGERFEARSTSIGTYAVYGLTPGRYTVSVNHDSLTFLRTDVHIRAGQKTGLDIELRVGRDERITVLTEGAAIALHDGAAGSRFSRQALDALPLSSGRTLQSMIAVVPGVVVTDATGTLAQFTAGGQRRFANRLTIDGMSADLAVDLTGPGVGQASTGSLPAFSTTGSTQTLVPLAAIGEMEIRTTNAPAEHQRAPGAQTAIVTRAGSDRLNASAFMDYRPNALAASDWFSNASSSAQKREVNFWNAGASLGGPVPLFDTPRLFYFASGERQRIDRPLTTTIQVPALSLRDKVAPALLPLLDAFPQPNGAEYSNGLADFTREFPVESKLSTVSLRVDGNVTDRHRLFTRINRGTSGGDEVDLVQQPRATFSHRETAMTNTATAGITSVFSSATHDLRVNVSTHEGTRTASPADYGSLGTLPLDLLVPPEARNDAWVRVQVAGGPGGFTIDGRGAAGRQEQFQVADTWTWLKGRHEWRFGIDFRRLTTSTDPAAYRYSYRFLNQGPLPLARVGVVVERALPSRSKRDTTAIFAQDSFRLTPRLTLNYGLRYSVRPAPQSVNDTHPLLLDFAALPELRPLPESSRLWKTSWTDLAPQVTSTYQLSNAPGRETSVRAGWSLVFDEVTSPGANAFGAGAPYVSRWSLSPPGFPVPANALSMTPPDPLSASDLADYYSFDSGLRSPRTHQWQVTLDQALGPVQRVGLAYVGAAARDLPYWHAYPFSGSSELRINAFSPDGRSEYHAMLAQYARRLSGGLQASLSYTWSHAIDLDSGDSLLPLPPPLLVPTFTNRGSSDFDRRHVLHATASYRVPGHRAPEWLRPLASDWQVDVVAMYRSGTPLTVTSLRSLKNGGGYALRPDLVENTPLWTADAASVTGESLNLAAFIEPAELRQGTLGRNTLRSSPLRQIDLSLSRFVRVGERRLTLRLNAFNVLNIPNVGPPRTGLESLGFGRPFLSYADALGTGTLTSGGLTPVQQVGGPRSIQMALRFEF
jgi:Carboxypeptidase regulatory-like domain/TonB dependent receptor